MALYEALAKACAAIAPVVKDATANGGKYKYSYATLAAVMEACRKPLADNGLLLIQTPGFSRDGGGQARAGVETRLVHVASGESLVFELQLPVEKIDAQGVGSAITYARRYAILSVLGMVAEDDDGAAACAPATSGASGSANRQNGGRPEGIRNGGSQWNGGRYAMPGPEDYMDTLPAPPAKRPSREAARVLGDFQAILAGDFANDGNRFAEALSNWAGRMVRGSADLSQQEIEAFVKQWKLHNSGPASRPGR